MIDTKLLDEPARLSALHRYDVLDSPAEAPFDKITALVKSILNVPISAVSLIDSDRQWFKSITGVAAAETPRSISFCSHAIHELKPMVVEDATNDQRFSSNPMVLGPPHIRSYAGAPLQTPDGYNVGALCAIDTVPRTFSAEQLNILTKFAALVVDELELRRIAERDHLTGVLSRRGFGSEVERAIKRFHRSHSHSVLALMDLDHFKIINDKYGHPAGDAVLKATTATCASLLRETDAFGRLGGEEFGILFTGIDKAGAQLAVEKIRRAIEAQLVPIADGIRVTASFGLAALHAETKDADEWTKQADEALYRAKRSGRNRSVFIDRGKSCRHANSCL